MISLFKYLVLDAEKEINVWMGLHSSKYTVYVVQNFCGIKFLQRVSKYGILNYILTIANFLAKFVKISCHENFGSNARILRFCVVELINP